MKEKIEILGDRFRGLWKSYEADGAALWSTKKAALDGVINPGWAVTFTIENRMIETPLFDDPIEALDFAIAFLRKYDKEF